MSMKLNCHDNVIVLENKNDQLILFKKFFFSQDQKSDK